MKAMDAETWVQVAQGIAVVALGAWNVRMQRQLATLQTRQLRRALAPDVVFANVGWEVTWGPPHRLAFTGLVGNDGGVPARDVYVELLINGQPVIDTLELEGSEKWTIAPHGERPFRLQMRSEDVDEYFDDRNELGPLRFKADSVELHAYAGRTLVATWAVGPESLVGPNEDA